MMDFDNNAAVVALREKISTLSSEAKEHKANLDRMMLEKVVSKVVPYIAMELVYRDELGRIVGKLFCSTIFYERCVAFEEVSEMKEPFDLTKVKENLKKDKIRSKPDKNGKRGEAGKSQNGYKEGCSEELQPKRRKVLNSFALSYSSARLCVFQSESYHDDLPDTDSFNDIHPHFDDDPLSGSTTYSANSLLVEFTDELALISYPSDYEDNRVCDIESDIREIEFLLYQGEDSDFKDSIDQSVLSHCNDFFVDPTPEMFTDEQPPDYSFPSIFDVYPDDFLEIESDATFDNDSFDFEGEIIKEAKLLIDQLDLPCDILSEYDSFASQDFSRDDVLPSPDNEDKVFNSRILSHEKSVLIITRVTQKKKLVVFYASWLFKDFDLPFYELLVFKDVPNSMRLLPFSSENEEKVFKPGIYTSKKFHCCFLPELSHPVSVSCQKPGHLAARLGCAETKFATWDDLAFKIMPFGLNVEHLNVKENPRKDKIKSKPNKNRKHGEAKKSQKQLQWIEEEKLNKMQKEGPEMQTHAKSTKALKKERKKRVKVAIL
uniref:Reverse transcriptase domain-containing protein n=1 Tax=Tanacetum cinerariifolium TaxID=118510 RepID=A0A6L2JQ51_TANCI|nr:hypothetical protein [Tanacetum cinerariifolium]